MSKLVNGLIPAGTACPFLDNCKFKVHTCPGADGRTKVNNFSCAAARLHDMVDAASLKRVQKMPDWTKDESLVIDDDEGFTE